jgi:hypothetical protein
MRVSTALPAGEIMCLPLCSILRLRPSFFSERGRSSFSGGAPDPRPSTPGPWWWDATRRVFRQFAWLQVDSVKATLSPLGRAPGMPSLRTACAIPPRRIELVEITSTPEGAYPLREDHPSGRYADASRWVSCGASIPNEANRKLRRIPCLARNLFTLPTSA